MVCMAAQRICRSTGVVRLGGLKDRDIYLLVATTTGTFWKRKPKGGILNKIKYSIVMKAESHSKSGRSWV